ncbi:arylalkylamine N-acetyltransferase 1 [Aphomia sociella]
MAQQSYTVARIGEEDVQDVMNLLQKTFYIDEPLNETVELCSTGTSCPELDEYCTHSLLEGLSFKAIDGEGNIIGVLINGICPIKEDDNGNDLLSQALRCKNPKFQKILHILALREEGSRLWEKYPQEQHLVEVKVAATDLNWRKRGVMNTLLRETEKAIVQKGINLLRMDTSSAYSAMSAERLGFTCVYQALYSELKLDGQPLIVPKSPHLYDKVFIKKLFDR